MKRKNSSLKPTKKFGLNTKNDKLLPVQHKGDVDEMAGLLCAKLSQRIGGEWKPYFIYHENYGWYYRVELGTMTVVPPNFEGESYKCIIGDGKAPHIPATYLEPVRHADPAMSVIIAMGELINIFKKVKRIVQINQELTTKR